MTDLIGDAIARVRARFAPPPRLVLSEWIEQNVELPASLSAQPGPVRLWAFQRGIADAISDPEIERVTVKKCVRVGYTTLLTGAVASFVANEPCPILMLLPTDDDCRDYVISDLDPTFEATAAVAGTLSAETNEGERNTICHRRFPGASLKIIAARAPRNLRRHTARVLLVDEEDGMDMTPEGDPVDLAIKRTISFPNRKIIRGSTPKDIDTSSICREYDASDRRVFEFQCVECGEFAAPAWSQIEWEKIQDAQGNVTAHRPETAAWTCPNCGSLVAERHKAEMVENGRWRATRPDVVGHAGFALSALISPHVNASWAALAAEYLSVHDEPDRLRAFMNTLLGEAWSDSVDEVTADALLNRSEAFGLVTEAAIGGEHLTMPEVVVLLTAGADVQDDRLETAIYGWDKAGTAFALGHFVLWGNTLEAEVWSELDQLLLRKWDHPFGGNLSVERAVVDSGDGGLSDTVYAFCWPRSRRGIMAGKGVWGKRPQIVRSTGNASGSRKGPLWIVGVDEIKQMLLTRLARYPDTVRFSRTLIPIWFAQLCSERRTIRRVAGRPVRRFERIGNGAAEALDATVYAFAARASIGHVDFDRRREVLSDPTATSAMTAPQPRWQTERGTRIVGRMKMPINPHR